MRYFSDYVEVFLFFFNVRILLKERVGHEIPESTVRGLRDKYVAQQKTSGEEVSSLNVLPRGRPLRLGPHDEAVQECIRELKRSGERVNAFVAMATARQVIFTLF
jgi:hypothetical protein